MGLNDISRLAGRWVWDKTLKSIEAWVILVLGYSKSRAELQSSMLLDFASGRRFDS